MKRFKTVFAQWFSRRRILYSGIGVFLVLLVVFAGIFSFLSCNNTRDSIKQYNLIVICVDTLRADHVGCYGYKRDTTPRIDSMAKEGILFENASSNSSFTRESVPVILTGQLPSVSGSTGWFAKPSTKVKGMGTLFKEAGYKTAFFAATNTMRFPEYTQGFDVFDHYSESKVSGNSPELSRMAIDFIGKNKNNTFMMYLHYLDPHGPYDPPLDFYKKFSPIVFPEPVGIYNHVRMMCEQLISEGFGPGEKRYEDLVLRYDAEIAHTDYSIGMVLDKLKELEILDNTVIVLTSDHGEEFLEHRFVEHGWTLFKEVTHVPLIFWGKPFSKPIRIAQPVSSVYILPTVLSALNIPHQRSDFDGHPLFSIKNGDVTFIPVVKPYIGELLVQHRNVLRAVVKDNWKYFASASWTLPENRPSRLIIDIDQFELTPSLHVGTWNPIRYEALYDLTTDPGEKTNVIASNPAKRDELRKILDQYEARCKLFHKGEIRQGNTRPALSPEEIKKLKSLGYM